VNRIYDTVLTVGRSRYPRLASVMNDAELPFKLMAVKFDLTWKGSIVTAVPGGLQSAGDSRPAYLIPVDIEVAGTAPCHQHETAMDCWKLVRNRADVNTVMLVRENDGLLIWRRTETQVEGKPWALEEALLREN